MSGGHGKAEYKRSRSGATAARRRIGLQRSYLVLHLCLLRVALFFSELGFNRVDVDAKTLKGPTVYPLSYL